MEPTEITPIDDSQSIQRYYLWRAVCEHVQDGLKQKEVANRYKQYGVSPKHIKNGKVIYLSHNDKMIAGLLSGDYAPDPLATQIRKAIKAGLSPAEIKYLEPDFNWYVYVIEQPGTPFHKIGKTKNPEVRFREVQRGNPYPLKKVALLPFPTQQARDDAERAILDIAEPAPGGPEWRYGVDLEKAYRIGQAHGGSLRIWS